MPGIPAPAHLSPFIDNAETGYIPDRQREINALAGIETAANAEDLSSESEKEEDIDGQQNEKDTEDITAQKGDLDSSSEEEGGSDLESSESDEVKITKAKKA